jgi:hypothetical protein
MLTTRRAAVNDTDLITRHRKAMFADMRDAPEQVLEEMASNFGPWVRRMIAEDKYAGWITSDNETPDRIGRSAYPGLGAPFPRSRLRQARLHPQHLR